MLLEEHCRCDCEMDEVGSVMIATMGREYSLTDNEKQYNHSINQAIKEKRQK